MQLSDEQKQLIREALQAVRDVNRTLVALRRAGIASNIRNDGPNTNDWMLDVKALIKQEHYL